MWNAHRPPDGVQRCRHVAQTRKRPPPVLGNREFGTSIYVCGRCIRYAQAMWTRNPASYAELSGEQDEILKNPQIQGTNTLNPYKSMGKYENCYFGAENDLKLSQAYRIMASCTLCKVLCFIFALLPLRDVICDVTRVTIFLQ